MMKGAEIDIEHAKRIKEVQRRATADYENGRDWGEYPV